MSRLVSRLVPCVVSVLWAGCGAPRPVAVEPAPSASSSVVVAPPPAPTASTPGPVVLTEDEAAMLDDLIHVLRSYPYAVPTLPRDHVLRDPVRRLEAVPAAFASLRRMVRSAAFRERYAKARVEAMESFEPRPLPPRTAEELQEQGLRDLARGISQLEGRIRELDKRRDAALKVALEKELARLRKAHVDLKKNRAPFEAQAEADRQGFPLLERAWDERRRLHEARWPANPQRLVLTRLRQLRSETPTAEEFSHQTTRGPGDSTVFVDPQDEARSLVWKAAYRAGPRASKVAFVLVEAWLHDLEEAGIQPIQGI